VGLWILKATGNAESVVAVDRFILGHQSDWFVREVLGMLRRTFARLDVSSRSLFAIVTADTCFAGTLLELALSADRIYMLDAEQDAPQPKLMLSEMNFGALPMPTQHSRLAMRYYQDSRALDALRARVAVPLSTRDAFALGLVTAAPDGLDWDDEVRQAIETRTALSPDALTGLEANLRFGLLESQDSRVFGRLSAWQNWIFIRPNAVGPSGALKVYGTGAATRFNWERV
jgi:benzoyl-CoA-dihydrodiol lyase